jgi:phage tail P2-like protein
MSDHLLPANASSQERALSLAIERAGNVPVPVRDVWNPDTCPAQLLGWLAWALSVDEWDGSWTDEQKRAVIKRSVGVHRYKGTIGAVREAIAALGLQAQVQEWFNQIPQAAPYTFRILLTADQVGATQHQQRVLLQVLERTKNLRSHLTEVQVIANTPAGPSAAACAAVGSEIVLTGYAPPKLVFNETTICI